MTAPPAVLTREDLDELIATLAGDGYRVIGPVVRDQAIVLAELRSGADLASGWGIDTAPGQYRLRRRDDDAVFCHSAGPQSWKQFLHPPRRKLWSADSEGFCPAEEPAGPFAFIGVRGCDLAAIATLDGVLGQGAHPDRSFGRRYQGLFVVAVGCTEPGGMCFCASMGTGPRPGPGYDLALTEQIDDYGHRFIAETGTPAGERILARVSHRIAGDTEVAAARAAVDTAAGRMGREMPALDLRELLAESRNSPSWEDAAAIRATLEQRSAAGDLVLFLNLADDPVIERILTPRLALTVAEHLAFSLGRHVLVVMADMTSYCEALREVLAIDELERADGARMRLRARY